MCVCACVLGDDGGRGDVGGVAWMVVRTDNWLGAEGAKVLGPALMKMVHISSLDLSSAFAAAAVCGEC